MSIPVSKPLDISSLQQESYHRGKLTYKLHKGQKLINQKLNEVTGQLVVINCSRQWGKTFLMVTKAIELAIQKPKSRIKIGTAFLSDLTEFILPTFDTVLLDCPSSIKPKYKVQGTKFVFNNGSEIKLVGLDKSPNGLRGSTIDLIVLDEAGFITNLDYLYKSVIVPATTHRPDCKIILISTPPATPAHPFLDFTQRAEAEGSYFTFDIYTNPMIDQDTIERLARESGGFESTTWRREYLCQFILDDDLALVKEWDDKYVQDIQHDQFFQYYHKLVGQDLGRKDHTALVYGYYDFKRAALIIEDESTMVGAAWTTISLKDEVNKKESQLWNGYKAFRRVSDNNNPHLLADLASIHNMHFMAVKKDSSLEQMVNRVREWVKQGRIIINPRCKMLIGCMKYGIWDKHRREFSRSTVYGHFDHFAALMYLLIHVPSSSNPIPADHGYTNHKSWLGNLTGKNTSHNAQVINRLFGPKRSK